MAEPAWSFAVAFATVLVAELGDKSQVLLLAQATRQPARRVLAEAVAAFAILCALAVTVGGAVARVAPAWVLGLAAGGLFLLFGALAARQALRPAADADVDEGRPRTGSTFLLVLASEMGDKTQLATAALAASTGQPVAVGAGALLALTVASVAAVLAGGWLATRLPARRRAAFAAVLLLAVGLATLAWTLFARP